MAKSTNNTKEAAWVALGNFFTFSFGIVSAMVLSRYFEKTEYGTYKQVFYIYNILLGMFTLGLPNAYSYFLARSPLDEAKNLIWKMTRLFMLLGLVMSIILFFGAGMLANIMKNPGLQNMLMIFAPVPFLMLPTLGLQNILVTFKKSNIIPYYVIITSLAQLLCVVLPVIIWGVGCRGALIGFNIGSLVAFGLALYLNTYPVRHEPDNKSTDTYKDIFKFAFPLFIATIWGTLINSTDQFFISRYFGTDVFADFSNGATDLPFVGMIIGATSAVLTPLFTRAVKDGENFSKTILPIWNSAFSKSIMLIYPLTFFCFFEAKNIMTFLYSGNYTESAPFFQIKVLAYFFKVIAFYSLIIALGASKFYQSVHMYEFLGLAITEYIVVNLFNNPLYITAVHVFFTATACLVFIYYISKQFKVKYFSMFPISIMLKTSLSSLVACLVFIGISSYYGSYGTTINLIIDFAIFVAVYALSCLVFKINYLDILRPLFGKRI